MNVKDTVSVVGDFMTCRESFIFSSINTLWYDALFIHKKKYVKNFYRDMERAHICGNVCPCSIYRTNPFLEIYYADAIYAYYLKKIVCKKLNNKIVPTWLNKLCI